MVAVRVSFYIYYVVLINDRQCIVRPACLLSLAGAATSVLFVATNMILSRQKFCCNKNMFAATTLQACFCRDQKIVFCLDKHVFVVTKLLSRQKAYLWQLPPMIVYGVTCLN